MVRGSNRRSARDVAKLPAGPYCGRAADRRNDVVGFNVMEHEMVPEHRLLEEEEAERLLAQLKVGREQLPKIKRDDPVIEAMEKDRDDAIEEGRVVEIRRRSATAGVFVAYRVVVER